MTIAEPIVSDAVPASIPPTWLASFPRGYRVVHQAADGKVVVVERVLRRTFTAVSTAVRLASGDISTDELTTILDSRLTEALPPLLVEILDTAGAALARQANQSDTWRSAQIGIAFDRRSPTAIAWAETHAGELIQGLSQELREAVRIQLAEALRQGWPPRRLATLLPKTIGLTARDSEAVWKLGDRMRENPGRLIRAGDVSVRVPAAGASEALIASRMASYGERLLRQRLLRIARTETIAAAVQGQAEVWLQAQTQGFLRGTEQRIWIATVGSDRTCPRCLALDGQESALDGIFTDEIGGVTVTGPPVHSACRCALGLAPTRRAS